jgi:hypothetical protein
MLFQPKPLDLIDDQRSSSIVDRSLLGYGLTGYLYSYAE